MKSEPNRTNELTQKELQFLESYDIESDTKIAFHVRAPRTLLLLMIITSGLYAVYWFYKNWQAVAHVSDRKIWPFWRTVFSIFYIWPLFKIMVLQAKRDGFTKNYSAGWSTLGYLFLPSIINWFYRPKSYNVGSMLVGLIGVAVSAGLLARAQEAAAYVLTHQDAKHHDATLEYPELTRFEKGFAVAGVILAVGLYLMLFWL